MYEKPLVVMTEELAEGIFAASGAATGTETSSSSKNTCTFTKTSENNWGSTGQKTYSVNVPSNADTNLQFKVEFSESVESIWGLGGSWAMSADKKSAICSVYSISGNSSCTFQGPTTAEINCITRIA